MGTNTLQSRLSLFFSHDGLLLPSFHARSYLLLTAARHPSLFKSGLAQHQSAQRMSLSSGQMCLAWSICPLPSAGVCLSMSSAHRGCFLTWHQGPGQSILWFSGWGHHGVQRRLQIYPSRRGDLPCTVALGTFSKLSEPFRTNRVTEEGILGNLSPKAGSQWPAGDDQGSTRGSAVDGASVEMASSSFSFSWQQPRCGRWGKHKTRSVCHSTSIWMDSGFWILRGSPDALSDHHARPAKSHHARLV